MCNWTEDGELFEDAGSYGGDIQCGRAYNRRFIHATLPGRIFDVTAYPIKGDGSDPMPDEDAPIRLQVMSQMTICTDTDDPGGTERWADIEYSELPERYDIDFSTVARAESAARDYVASFDPERFIGWDGRPAFTLDDTGNVDNAGGIFLSREQLSEWAGFPLTDEQLARLEAALPHSSIPDAVATIADNITSTESES